jgi:hypothetical protein
VHEPRRDIEVVSLPPECRGRLSPEPNHPHRDKAHCSTSVGERMEIHPEIVMLKGPFLVRNVPFDGDRPVGAVDILAQMAIADGPNNAGGCPTFYTRGGPVI